MNSNGLFRSNRWSALSIMSCTFLMCYIVFCYYPKWENSGSEAIISWDVSGYYMYLPAVFIYKDLKAVAFLAELTENYSPDPSYSQTFHHTSGAQVFKYSSGMALQYIPAFAIAHTIALSSNQYAADGFSRPYQVALGLQGLAVALLSLVLLRNLLLRYFTDEVTAILLFALVFGTNYLTYSTINSSHTHNYLFLSYVLLILSTIRYYNKRSFVSAFSIGAILGVMILTRPTEIIAFIIPVFYNLNSFLSAKERFTGFFKYSHHYIGSAIVMLLVCAIQVVYWHHATGGEYIVYSYGDQGFSWLQPHFIEGLFSYRSGWITYSPIFLFVVPGFVLLYNARSPIFFMTLIHFLVFIYVTFSWDMWWYGVSLGQRAMIQCYPLLMFPIGAFAAWLWSGSSHLRIGLIAIILTLAYYNLWQTHQAHRGGLLEAGNMNKRYFWEILGKYKIDDETVKLLDTDELLRDEEPVGKVLLGYVVPFPTSFSLLKHTNDSISLSFYRTSISSGSKWLRTEFRVCASQDDWNINTMQRVYHRYYSNGHVIKSNFLRVNRFLNGEEDKCKTDMYFDSRIPEADFDSVVVSFHSRTGVAKLDISKVENYSMQ